MDWCKMVTAVLTFVLWLPTSGCSATAQEISGVWVLKSVDGVDIPLEAKRSERPIYFRLSGLEIEGYDGCNEFFGSIEGSGNIASTRRGCPDDYLKIPLDLNELDLHLGAATVSDDTLSVPARGDYPASVFVRRP